MSSLLANLVLLAVAKPLCGSPTHLCWGFPFVVFLVTVLVCCVAELSHCM